MGKLAGGRKLAIAASACALLCFGGGLGCGTDEAAKDAVCDSERPSAIPGDWKRFPGLPCKCDVWVASEPNDTAPAADWISTADGILELADDPAAETPGTLPASARGGSYAGEQLIAYGRDLRALAGGTSVREWTLLRLPANEILFRGRAVESDSRCGLATEAIGQGSVLHFAFDAAIGGGDSALAGGPAPARGGVPALLATNGYFERPDAIGRQIIAGIGSADILFRDAVDVMPLGASPRRWTRVVTAADNHSLDLLAAWDSTVFFMDVESVFIADANDFSLRAEIWAWDEARGLRRFLSRTGDEPDQIGSVCGLGTDGETLVWTQYSGWNGSAWDRMDIMKAPFTTDETALEPVRLRAAPGGRVGCGPWRVGAVYAASQPPLAETTPESEKLDVIRLSDGQAFGLPVRPSFQYWNALYVTADEIAMEGKHTDESWTIVRFPLSLLGPGTPAPTE